MKESRFLVSVGILLLCCAIKPTVASSVNVALGGQASASSWIGPLPSAPNYPATPDKAIDGDLFLEWNSGDIPVGWIEIDLGQSYSIELIRGLTEQNPDSDTTHNVYLDGSLTSWGVGLFRPESGYHLDSRRQYQ